VWCVEVGRRSVKRAGRRRVEGKGLSSVGSEEEKGGKISEREKRQ